MIVDERFVTYINSLDTENTSFLEELEKTAKEAYVPIIRREMQSLLKLLLAMKRPIRILEVGTAVGFSALLMAEYNPVACEITTIENYEKRIDISYITEKIKQWDEQNSISIGTFHNKTALIHTEMTAGKKYYTYIYQENGALRELMIRDGLDTKKVQGEEIVPAKGFEIKEQNQMYDIRITGEDGVKYRTCVYRQSRE